VGYLVLLLVNRHRINPGIKRLESVKEFIIKRESKAPPTFWGEFTKILSCFHRNRNESAGRKQKETHTERERKFRKNSAKQTAQLAARAFEALKAKTTSNPSGKIGADELVRVFIEGDTWLSKTEEEQVRAIIEQVDTDNSKGIDLEEFTQAFDMLTSMNFGNAQLKMLRATFDRIDVDKGGTLGEAELMTALSEYGQPPSIVELRAMMREATSKNAPEKQSASQEGCTTKMFRSSYKVHVQPSAEVDDEGDVKLEINFSKFVILMTSALGSTLATLVGKTAIASAATEAAELFLCADALITALPLMQRDIWRDDVSFAAIKFAEIALRQTMVKRANQDYRVEEVPLALHIAVHGSLKHEGCGEIVAVLALSSEARWEVTRAVMQFIVSGVKLSQPGLQQSTIADAQNKQDRAIATCLRELHGICVSVKPEPAMDFLWRMLTRKSRKLEMTLSKKDSACCLGGGRFFRTEQQNERTIFQDLLPFMNGRFFRIDGCSKELLSAQKTLCKVQADLLRAAFDVKKQKHGNRVARDWLGERVRESDVVIAKLKFLWSVPPLFC
jgi:Ca2+-binding EF-hand superfamily protein